jgi:ATP/maltotriose-dependent transcriptional regulator MalT
MAPSGEATESRPTSRTGQWPLIGRDRELEQIATALRAGAAGGVVLTGPLGVGKSRLGREALRLASDGGLPTVRAIATQSARSIPLGTLAPLLPVARARPPRPADLVQQAVDGLTGRAGRGRLVLLMDDAHLLDDASATVLLHLASARDACVVVTLRAGEPAPDAITTLWREGIAERVEVAALGRSDTDRLLAAALGGPVDGATVRDLFEASRGNPLFLRELVLGGLDAGLLRDDSGIWRLVERLAVPPLLAELVEARLADVSRDERAVLEIVAIADPIRLEVLTELTSYAAIDGAERRGLLTVTMDASRREVRLAHPLHGEVLRMNMTALRSMTINRLLADAMEQATRRDDVLRVAVWRLEGGGEARPELMLEAARRAHFAHDSTLAERLARAASAAGAGVNADVLLGEILGELGRHVEAEALLADAASRARRDRDHAMIAMKRAETLYWGLAREDDARTVLLATESAIGDRAWREELAGVRASYELFAGRPLVALDAVDSVLARSAGRPFVEGVIVAAPALAIVGRTEEAIALADRALAAHLELGEQQVLSDPGIHLVARVLALGEAGRLSEGAVTAHAGCDAALDARSATGRAWFSLMRGRIGLLEGKLQTAHERFLEAAALFDEIGQPGPRRWCLAGLVLTAVQGGELEAATEPMAALDASSSTPMLMMEPDVDRARAWHHLALGNAAAARKTFESAAARARTAGAFALESGALHDLARAGAPDAAALRLAELADAVDGELAPARAAHAAALARDDPDALDHGAETFAALGAMLLGAESAAAAAAAHRRVAASRNAQRSARRAAALVELCERVGTPALALAGPVGVLTRREREVATLAAARLSSREIAEQMVVSVRTVESHLQRAYEKLGVQRRSQLAGALAAEDLETP